MKVNILDSIFLNSKKDIHKNEYKIITGIDINDKYICFTTLEGKNISDFFLSDFNIEYLEQGIIENGIIQDLERLISFLQQLIKKSKINIKNIVLGISHHLSHNSIVKYSNQLTSIDEFISHEISQITKSSIDDFNYDYLILNNNDDKESYFFNVMLVFAKKIYIEQNIYLADFLNCNLKYIDLNLSARFNAFLYWLDNYKPCIDNIDSKVVIYLYIYNNVTNLDIYFNNESIYHDDINYGVSNFIDSLRFSSNLDDVDVLKGVFEKKTLAINDFDSILDNYLNNILENIERSIHVFNATRPDNIGLVEDVFIASNSYIHDGLDVYIKKYIGINAYIISPLDIISKAENIDNNNYKNIYKSLYTSFGLALRGFL